MWGIEQHEKRWEANRAAQAAAQATANNYQEVIDVLLRELEDARTHADGMFDKGMKWKAYAEGLKTKLEKFETTEAALINALRELNPNHPLIDKE